MGFQERRRLLRVLRANIRELVTAAVFQVCIDKRWE